MAFDPSKTIKQRAVMLSGPEETLRRDALRNLETALSTKDPDYEAETLTADQKSPQEWLANVGSVPFLSERRVLIVRNLLRADPAELWDAKPKSKDHPFAKALASLPETAFLVLVADEEQGDEDRQSRLDGVCKRWEEIVKTGGGTVASFETDRKGLAELLRKRAKENGRQLSPGAASLLVEMTGGSLTIAYAELDKAILFTHGSEAITESVIKTVVAPEQEYNVYQLVDSVVAGDSGAALRQLRVLVGQRDKMETQAFSRIFPTVSKQFRIIWQARLCIEANCQPSNPSPLVLSQLPAKPRITDEPEWRRSRAVQAARRIGLRQIQQVFEEIVSADAKIKGMEASYTTTDAMEQMVLNMAAICRGRS